MNWTPNAGTRSKWKESQQGKSDDVFSTSKA